MYVEGYELILEILQDEELNAFVLDKTGKKLAVIDSGPQVTTPAAGIFFQGLDVGQIADRNTLYRVGYNVVFALPFWGTEGMRLCHEFLDKAIDAFLSHRRESSVPGRANFIESVQPLLVEDNAEKEWWTVAVRATVAIY